MNNSVQIILFNNSPFARNSYIWQQKGKTLSIFFYFYFLPTQTCLQVPELSFLLIHIWSNRQNQFYSLNVRQISDLSLKLHRSKSHSFKQTLKHFGYLNKLFFVFIMNMASKQTKTNKEKNLCSNSFAERKRLKMRI